MSKQHLLSALGATPDVSLLDRDSGLRIIATNIGKESWDHWNHYVNGGSDSTDAADDNSIEGDSDTIDDPKDGFPPMESLSDYTNPPALPEDLIAGILRLSHKMIISGCSKAGKSVLLMELCIAIAEGLSWLGFQCRQGRVLYVNLEIDNRSAVSRFFDIYNAEGIPTNNMANITIWNLRGHAVPLDQLVPALIERIRGKGFSCVVIDPLYKLLGGKDENSATAMAELVNNFDRICTETGCSVIYCHHHSKGAQGAKKAADRASGSGVFARDPDAQLDIIELEISAEARAKLPNDTVTAWRMESSLREFANITPVNFLFSYPVHWVDEDGILSGLSPAGAPQSAQGRQDGNGSSEDANEAFRKAYDMCNIDGEVKVEDLAVMLGLSDKTIYSRLTKLKDEFSLDKGVVTRLRDKGG